MCRLQSISVRQLALSDIAEEVFRTKVTLDQELFDKHFSNKHWPGGELM